VREQRVVEEKPSFTIIEKFEETAHIVEDG
jgi:hypothetical protein